MWCGICGAGCPEELLVCADCKIAIDECADYVAEDVTEIRAEMRREGLL